MLQSKMEEPDYVSVIERLCLILIEIEKRCIQELPEGFSAYNYKNHDDFWLFLARVVGKQRICFEGDHLERFHQFPYIAGVDIFVLDYVSRDEKAEPKRDELAMHVLVIADSFGDEVSLSKESQEMGIKKIEAECGG